MDKRILLLCCLVFIAFPLKAQSSGNSPIAASTLCVRPEKLANLCNVVGLRVPANDPSGRYEYRYQQHIEQAACVTPTDNEVLVAKKVQAMWSASQDYLRCSNMQFDVAQGSVLKYAVAKVFTPFIEDAIQVWQVDLNHVDPSDSRTVLDYVKRELSSSIGTPNETILSIYYGKLRDAGALHAAEL